MLIRGAHVYLPSRRFADRDVLLRNGAIQEVGKALNPAAGPDIQTIAAKGRTLMPAFFDSHTHFYTYARSLSQLDVEHLRDINAFKAAVADYIHSHDQEVILGRGWSKSIWNNRLPSLADLDAVSDGRLVLLASKDAHSLFLNTRALTALGITPQTRVNGGNIETDDTGRLTGIVSEKAVELAQPLLDRAMDLNQERIMDQIRHASKKLLAHGITGFYNVEKADAHRLLHTAEETGHLLQDWVCAVRPDELPWQDLPFAERVKGMKFFLDGALGNLEASLLQDYSHKQGHKGILYHDLRETRRLVELARQHNLPVVVHAIGDRALQTVIQALRAAPAPARDRWDQADRVEHCQLLYPAFQDQHVPWLIFSMQPCHLLNDIVPIGRFWAGEREQRAYAMRTLANCGYPLIFGTDLPIEPPDPFWGIYAAVARRTKDGFPRQGFYPNQAVTLKEAIDAYTTRPAGIYLADRGIAAGNRANMILLNQRLPEQGLPARSAARLKVETVFLGDKIYTAETLGQ